MPVAPEERPLYIELQKKRNTLFNYIAELVDSKTAENETYVNNAISKANFELQRLHAVMSDLNNNNPIEYPSDEQIRSMRDAVAALELAVARSAAVTALIAAGSAVIAAFPT